MNQSIQSNKSKKKSKKKSPPKEEDEFSDDMNDDEKVIPRNSEMTNTFQAIPGKSKKIRDIVSDDDF